MADTNSENSYIELDIKEPKKRSTDKLFLVIFVIVFIIWVELGICACGMFVYLEGECDAYRHSCNQSSPQREGNFSIFDSNERKNIPGWLQLAIATVQVEVSRTKEFYLLASGLSLLAGLVFLSTLQWTAGVCAWASIVFVLLLLTASGFSCFVRATQSPPAIIPIQYLNMSASNQWTILIVILFTMSIVYCIVIYRAHKKITVGIDIIRESSKVMKMPFCYFMVTVSSGVCLILVLGFFAASLLALIRAFYIMNSCFTCPSTANDSGKHANKTNYNENKYNQELYLVIGCYTLPLLWIVMFIRDFYYAVIGGSFAITFQGRSQRRVPLFEILQAMKTTIRYHIGTVALGSLLGTLLIFIKLTISVFTPAALKGIACIVRKKHMTKKIANKKKSCSFALLLHGFELFLMLKYACIISPMYGTGYTESLRKVQKIWKKEVISFCKVSRLILILIKFAVPGIILMTTVFINIYTKLIYIGIEQMFWVYLLAFIIFHILFSVLCIAAETATICFLDELDKNGGSVSRNIKMPQILLNSLSK